PKRRRHHARGRVRIRPHAQRAALLRPRRRSRKRRRGVTVNALALELLGVAKEYLGPAAPAFLSRELHAMGVNANNVERTHILPLAERARLAAAKVMDNKKASEFAQALRPSPARTIA